MDPPAHAPVASQLATMTRRTDVASYLSITVSFSDRLADLETNEPSSEAGCLDDLRDSGEQLALQQARGPETAR